MKFKLNHHAYFLEGDRESARRFFDEAVKDFFGDIVGNPDVLILKYDSIKIDEAREIITYQSSKPVQSDKRFFYIECGSVLREAQNALLKSLEDPQSQSVFFLNSSSWQALLPTVRSRLLKITLPHNEKISENLYKGLGSKSLGERLKTIEKISADIKAEKITSEDAFRIAHPYIKNILNNQSGKNMGLLQATELFIKHGRRKGASIKQLLETWAILQ